MEKRLQKPAVVCLLALICCALWGSAFPCIKVGYEWFGIEGTGSQILFAGYRFFLAGVLTFIFGCILEKRFLTMKRSSIPYILRQGFLQTTVQYFFFYVGLANTTGTKGSIINASNAFVSIVAAHFMLKNEKMTWQKGIGCILGLAGVVVINLAPGAWGTGFSIQGEGMVLICTTAYGISTVVLKMISDLESPMTITSYQILFGSVLLIVIGLALDGHVEGFTLKSTLLLIYMALISTVAFSIWTILLKYNPVGKVAIYGFTIPVFGVALSAIFLGEEIFSLKNLTALILVSVGILIVNHVKGGTSVKENS
ncbi:DMT family transporter [Faecalicatena sp. AGMB00832]|uniref:DMT family transporter n=1 Tax=Faecalicatena faecalis TaxID=2726362 RepID=A0ABS6D695_9FIRM|nr:MULTISPECIES: DMT family transporter [Faecalicatena]MBU3877127.1 DMT family transporter [Faecalicatena faecalis]MCI6467132.1 DMT family transporter [Faecalicatena sp.]MDY5618916.1 DMT family transporter [Lachnospiraceae bacterium]